MLIGAMNNPGRPLAEQIQWLGKMDFDFLDLTLEPPHAASWKIDAPALKRLLADSNLRVVGHTAPFLPLPALWKNSDKQRSPNFAAASMFSNVLARCI